MWFIIWVTCAILGTMIGGAKGHGALGLTLGLLLGPLGLIIVLLLPEEGVQCPFCRETVKPDAVVCKHCGRDLPKKDETPPSAPVVEEQTSAPVAQEPPPAASPEPYDEGGIQKAFVLITVLVLGVALFALVIHFWSGNPVTP